MNKSLTSTHNSLRTSQGSYQRQSEEPMIEEEMREGGGRAKEGQKQWMMVGEEEEGGGRAVSWQELLCDAGRLTGAYFGEKREKVGLGKISLHQVLPWPLSWQQLRIDPNIYIVL